MKKIGGILFLALCGLLIAACTPPATNTAGNGNANSNANAKPAAAAPSADTLLAMDKQANEAYFKGDGDFFKTFLSDKAVGFDGANANGKDAIVKEISTAKCDMKSYSLDEPKVVMIDNDDYVLIYKGTFDGTCTQDGKTEKVPSPMRAATLYNRNGEQWQAVWHDEVAIVSANGPSPSPASNSNTSAKPVSNSNSNSNTNSNSKSNSNSNSSSTTAAAPPKSSNTDALMKLHGQGWEAFKNKDAKWFDANLTSGFANVGPMGDFFATKADTIKEWTETMKCEGITKANVSDGYSVALSPTLELFHVKGNADGKCDGHPNGDLWQTNVYVKEGDAWKLAFMFENMPHPGM